jgi:3-hydroxyisobutyrate dehydrogenase-like beta-hydroxyacid dehydrogenase
LSPRASESRQTVKGGGKSRLLGKVWDATNRLSNDTIERAKAAKVEVVSSDVELVQQCSVFLSVVPPRDAAETAQRVVDALSGAPRSGDPLHFVDLNAVSPATARNIASLIERSRAPIRFVDGCILGAPPTLKASPDPGTNVSSSEDPDQDWDRPGIPVSGPFKLSDIPDFGPRLFEALNMKHISDDIGAASGLKMCFASTSKGFTAIAIQAFTTAQRLGVLSHLQEEMAQRLPNHLRIAERSMVVMPPKAYRWVKEMEEISDTHAVDGGFEPYLFQGAAGVFRSVAEDSVLGEEKIGRRKRGTTAEDVAAAMAEGLAKKQKKTV